MPSSHCYASSISASAKTTASKVMQSFHDAFNPGVHYSCPIILILALEMLLDAPLLSSCFPILLDVDMVIRLQGMDGIIGELHPVNGSAIILEQ